MEMKARALPGLRIAFGWKDDGTSWARPLADPPDQREVDENSTVGLLACGSNRPPAFPTHDAPVAYGHPSPPTVAGAAPDWSRSPHRIPCYPLAGTMDAHKMDEGRGRVNRDIKVSLYDEHDES